MQMRMKRVLGCLGLVVLASGVQMPQAHAGSGSDVFAQECAECHSLREGKNKKGPSLFAVVGRKAGSVADFNYSDAMKTSGLTWTPSQIDAYVSHPRTVVPEGKMKYDGLADAQARADLIAFLGTVK
jgi:cytochrome c